MLHYYPRHVLSINMPIFRRKNCIHAASGIFALCKRLHSTLVESGLQYRILEVKKKSLFKTKYSHAHHIDVSVDDGTYIRRWSHNIIT